MTPRTDAADPIRAGGRVAASPPDRAELTPSTVAHARELLAMARRRMEALGAVGDPAWHMLLDLAVTGSTGTALGVSDVCCGSLSPYSTAHRHLVLLEERGLLVRSLDPADRRRQAVALTVEGVRLVRDLLVG